MDGPRTGALIAGRYELGAELGSGGFGAVFRARDKSLGRSVALKVLHAVALEQTGGVERFRREVALAMDLVHPNTVRVLDAGIDQATEGPFIVFELLEGESLDVRLRRLGPMPQAEAAKVVMAILASLDEAHGRGVVHRDIKPANVFLAKVGSQEIVKVLDFGIAKASACAPMAEPRVQLTRQGQTLGTPAYMAPEQARGQAVTPAADLYAVGLLFAELLTASPVYSGATSLSILVDKVQDLPPPLRPDVVASPLGAVIEEATRPHADRRFASASAMRQAIEHALSTAGSALPTKLLAVPGSAEASSSHGGSGAPLGHAATSYADSSGPTVAAESFPSAASPPRMVAGAPLAGDDARPSQPPAPGPTAPGPIAPGPTLRASDLGSSPPPHLGYAASDTGRASSSDAAYTPAPPVMIGPSYDFGAPMVAAPVKDPERGLGAGCCVGLLVMLLLMALGLFAVVAWFVWA